VEHVVPEVVLRVHRLQELAEDRLIYAVALEVVLHAEDRVNHQHLLQFRERKHVELEVLERAPELLEVLGQLRGRDFLKSRHLLHLEELAFDALYHLLVALALALELLLRVLDQPFL